MRSYQRRLAALNLDTSSKKSLWQLKKNDNLGANWSISNPFSIADSTYAKALDIVKANSWTAVDPASRI